jgi:hypothetical protein
VKGKVQLFRKPALNTSNVSAAAAVSRDADWRLMRLVLDTSVLIDHLRGRSKAATEIIPRAIARGDELWSSYVVRAEELAGMRAGQETATRDLLGLITWVDVDE